MKKSYKQLCKSAVLVTLALCVVLVALPSCHHYPDQSGFLDVGERASGTVVQLLCAKMPYVSAIALH